jgi:hypothetical protein
MLLCYVSVRHWFLDEFTLLVNNHVGKQIAPQERCMADGSVCNCRTAAHESCCQILRTDFLPALPLLQLG